MSKINLEGKFPTTNKEQTSFSVKDAEDMTIEELIESIRYKIQRIHKKNARKEDF